jgi:hypothetical protein
MNLAIEILNKEIERREILLAVENNVLIQNDMSNEIGVLKDSVKNLALFGVSNRRKLLFRFANDWNNEGWHSEHILESDINRFIEKEPK